MQSNDGICPVGLTVLKFPRARYLRMRQSLTTWDCCREARLDLGVGGELFTLILNKVSDSYVPLGAQGLPEFPGTDVLEHSSINKAKFPLSNFPSLLTFKFCSQYPKTTCTESRKMEELMQLSDQHHCFHENAKESFASGA